MTDEKRHIWITTSNTTFDLNGKKVTRYDDYGLFSTENANVSIQDSIGGGAINGNFSINSGSLTLNSGTIQKVSCQSSTFYANGGTVSKAATGGRNGTITQHTGTTGTTFTGEVINGGTQSGTISGGIFKGKVINGGNIDICTISNGIFYGEVINSFAGNITGGAFHGEVKNYDTIGGGVFYDKVLNKSGTDYIANINGGVFYGGIEDNGGTITDPYHTVSFNLNVASIAAPVTQYFVNTDTAKALEPAAPTREGYEFAGWYNGDTKYDFTQNVTEDITLTAKWVLSKYTVSLNTNGGTINSGNVEEYMYGQGATLPTDVTKDGYSFAGWYDNEELSGTPVTEISTTDMDTKTYWAKWEDIEKPVIKGLEESKTYCDTVQFEVFDNDGISSVTANGDPLTPESNGKYSLEKGKGEVTVVVKDKANNETTVTVTVKDGHSLEHFDAKEASVSETGTKEYWQCKDCENYFSDENGTNEISLEDIVISKKAPVIIKGKGQSVTQGTKKTLSFTSNASIDDFMYVKLGGETLDSKNYTVKSGSIVVTLKSDFVSTLKAGKHTISIVSESGEAATEFEVIKKEAVKDSNKTNTGLIGNAGLWISMMVSSLDALLIGLVLKRKKCK